MKVIKAIFTLFFLLLCLSSKAQTQIKLKFATLSEAQSFISADDHYTKGLSPFDIDSRVGKVNSTVQELKELQKAECREWFQSEIDIICKSFKIIEQRLVEGGYNIPLPTEVVMIKTTMREEGNAGAYTRENQIYVGSGVVGLRKMRDGTELPIPSAESLCSLMAHELFHVLTRNNLNFKSAMYRIIGFTRLEKEIQFPDDVLTLRISNPDVSCYDSYANITVNGVKQNCTMINVANKAYEGGSFFRYLKVGFIPLDNNFTPIVKDGKTVIYDLDDATDFYNLVGRNTGYVINPEECLADNFSIAVNGFQPSPRRQELPNPEIIEKIREALKIRY